MKFYIFLSLLLMAGVMACHKKADIPCRSMVIREQIMRVDPADSNLHKGSTYMRARCAAKCPDGIACDSSIELTNTSMGVSVRRIKCVCEPGGVVDQGGIIIEHTRHTPDSIVTRLYCAHGVPGQKAPGACVPQEVRLPDDTIRSRSTGVDSLIVMKWEVSCRCPE